MPTNKVLSVERLLEIEQAALLARRQATEQLAHLGEEMKRDAGIDLLKLVASVLTNAIVEARPNLEHDKERLAGVLRYENGSLHLLFEAYDLPVRQRFSLAHEIGHFVLHSPEGQPLYQCCISRNVQPEEFVENDEDNADLVSIDVPDREAEADAFAAAFLLPRDEIRADLARFGRSTSFLAQRYCVSEPTIGQRLRELDSLFGSADFVSDN